MNLSPNGIDRRQLVERFGVLKTDTAAPSQGEVVLGLEDIIPGASRLFIAKTFGPAVGVTYWNVPRSKLTSRLTGLTEAELDASLA
jgi:hypothetical protein